MNRTIVYQLLCDAFNLRIRVRGNSMKPLLSPGDRVFVKKGIILPGDVILFKKGDHLVVHRFLFPYRKNREWYLVCKGDNRPCFDRLIMPEDVMGKVVLSEGWLKRLLNLMKGIYRGILTRLSSAFNR